MKYLSITVSGLVLAHGAMADFYEPPPTTADPNTIQDCTWWYVAATGDACASIASSHNVQLSNFQTWNPSLAGTLAACSSKLVIGNSYCIEQNYGLPSEIYTSTTSSARPTTATQVPITTPTPHRTFPSDCNKFHFVVSGNLCPGIASQYNIPLATFYSWNPDVGSTCNNLWLDEYVCVGRVSYVPTTTTTTTSKTTTTGTGIATPTPHRTLPNDCNKFHFVVSGNLCPGIATQYNIPLAQFYAWNPDVGSNCNNLWLDEYVCVGRVSYVPTTTTTGKSTTTTGTGIATPTPHRTLPSNCDRFHFVVSGNLCPGIAAQYNIPLAQFYAWNPDVGSNCNNLWLDEYVCVRTVGFVAPTSTTSRATTTGKTTTTTGNGIPTPTPHRTLPSNCDRFHFVVSGNLCGTIASQYNIPIAQFYTWNPDVGSNCNNLWLDEYVCVRTVGFVAPTSTTRRTTSTTTNGIATPTPVQSGMHPNCKKFHKVVSGNTCQIIASQYSISLTNFYAWNTGVGNQCQTLFLDYYVCVGI